MRGTALKTVLIDLSGTLHIENAVTPEAVQSLARLREAKLNLKFVTNTTKESKRFLHDRLVKLGFDIKPDEIFTSLSSARALIEKESLKPMFMVDQKAMEDFKGLTDFDETPNAVVVGLAPDMFNRKDLNQAFRHIIHNKAKLIAIHEARYYMRSDGLALGPGPFVKVLEYATGVKGTVVGKPSADFFKRALDGVDPEEAVMIGDDVKDDIEGAQAIGMKGYLVKTGKYREGDENKIEPEPYKTVDNFSAAVDHIITSLESK